MTTIQLTETRYQLKEGTKTAYKQESVKTEEITEKQHFMYEDSCSFFRRLGGSETVTRGYTCAGYKMTKLVSKSPDRKTKVVREFKFIWKD